MKIRNSQLKYLILLVFLAHQAVWTASARAQAMATLRGVVSAPTPKNRANAVISLKPTGKAPSIVKTAHMDQKGLVFTPRVLPIQKGSAVAFLNSDPVAHSVFSNDGEKYDLGTWPQGQTRNYTFQKTGIYRQLCRVHDDMIAFIVVLETPYFAVSDKAGEFAITGLPPGSYTMTIWHEKLASPERAVTVVAGDNPPVQIALGAR